MGVQFRRTEPARVHEGINCCSRLLSIPFPIPEEGQIEILCENGECDREPLRDRFTLDWGSFVRGSSVLCGAVGELA